MHSPANYLRRRRIYLMRHADVDYADPSGRLVNPDQVALTTRGQEQARAAALALADIPLDRAIVSGLPRTQQTADLVLTGRDVPTAADVRWREIHVGKLAVVTPSADALRAIILNSLPADLTPEHRFLGGETFGEMQSRILAAWRDLLAIPNWRNGLIVSHGIANRVLLAWMLGAPLGAVGKIEQDACCINLIEVADDGTPLVRLVNYTPSNPLKHGMTHSTLEGLARMVCGRTP